MKILIVTSEAGSWPYIPEMMEEFEKRGEHAELFDIDNLGPKRFATKVAFKFAKLRYRTSVALLKRRLALLPTNFDAVNIHFAAPIYRDLAKSLKRRGQKLITSIWGSDFLRAGPSALRNLGDTFQVSDIVTTNNPEVLEKLVSRYPSISDRVRVVPFGLRSLDVISQLQQSETHEKIRKTLDIPSTKLVVSCGYNATREQRHGMMIEALARLCPAAKSKLLVLMPMTYPLNPSYVDEVRQLLTTTNVEYRILDEKLSIEDVARIRVASDYAVNMQTTDSLSASVQEHLFAGSSMIVGEWLPYTVLEKMGIPMHRAGTAEEISAALEKAVALGNVGRTRPDYADRLYAYSSWNSNARKWLDLYGKA